MKRKLILAFMLLLGLNAFSKPIITYSYTGSILQFWFGSYAYVKSTATYEMVDGKLTCTRCDVKCEKDGAIDCKAEYKNAVSPNPFTQPEQDLIWNMQLYAKCEIESGVTDGTHSETITIQSPNNQPETYRYTITWNVNGTGGFIKITNTLMN